ncbi:hypothetical protein WDW86_09325 [Bdellovibrionota bacterium FG-2]
MKKIAVDMSPKSLVFGFALTTFLIGSGSSHAFETDQLSQRNLNPLDASQPVNDYANRFLEKCRVKLNSEIQNAWFPWSYGSDEKIAEKFRLCVFKANPFSFHYFGARVEGWMRTTLEGQGYSVGSGTDKENNIYGDFRGGYLFFHPWHPSPLVFDFARLISGELSSPTFMAGDVRFGADKLSHLFRLGYKYWKRSGGGVEDAKALHFGTSTELGMLGQTGIGVFSYADLSANYAGYQFYQNLIASIEDPAWLNKLFHYAILWDVGKNIAQIERIREFQISDYATQDWDEYLNPSVYVSSLQQSVTQHLKEHRKEICAQYLDWKYLSATPIRPLRAKTQYVDISIAPTQVDPFRVEELCRGN